MELGANILSNLTTIAWINLVQMSTESVFDILTALAERA
jgi:hypothetical protein